MQFDPQGSDGASAGYVFDQSMRPYKLVDPQLTAGQPRPATPRIHVDNADKFQEGVWIAVGQGTDDLEIREITTIDGLTLNLAKPLENKHHADDWAGTEFHTERWYPDVDLDNVFWHDHVDGIHGWGKGLVGQLIVEPKGSTYHDPQTGEEVDSGELVDIHTPNSVAPGVARQLPRARAVDDRRQPGHRLDAQPARRAVQPSEGPTASQLFSSYR